MTDTAASVEFLTKVFGPTTTCAVFVCSLPNDRNDPNEPGEKRLMSRDPEALSRFVGKWDRPGRGLFFCVGTIRDDAQPATPGGSPRSKANVAEIGLLNADIDLKDVSIGADEILSRLATLPLPPSFTVRSGNGVHAYWLLNEGIEADADTIERVEAALRQLGDLVGGDLKVAEIARLMRVPGSHNSKNGAWTPVTIATADYDRRYELDDVEDMLGYVSPIIHRKLQPIASALETAANPFLAVAQRLGFRPPIDVERRLASMTYQGVGENSVHETQLQVSASLLNTGMDIAEVVDVLMDTTRAAAGAFGARWNWPREERAVWKMCEDWRRKHPVAIRSAPPAAPKRRTDDDDVVQAEVVNGAPIVQLADARAKRDEKRAKPAKAKRERETAVQVVVADGVVEAIRQDAGDILLAEGDIWIYREGVWAVMSPTEEQWLKTLVQRGCDALGHAGDSKAANAAWKRLTEHPDLHRRQVHWDQSDVIVAANGMVDLKTRTFSPFDPERYARRKVGVAFEPGATCSKFRAFLQGCFSDRLPADRDALMSLLQECFGSMLAVRVLAREQRKALFLVGPSRTGKTQLATIARRLIGEPVASPSIMDMTKEFGLQALYGARAWIRDDAINENDQLDPARFKTIVTGEPVDVNRKGKTYVTTSFELPIVLTTNAMPRARDASDAIYNRSIVLDMTNVVDEVRADIERRALGFSSAAVLADALVEAEGPGILNWALDGLDRLRARGRFDLPEIVNQSVQRFKDANNPIAEWARVALVKSTVTKVEKSDLLCCLHGWQKEEHGDDAKAMGGRALYVRLQAVMPGIDLKVKANGGRFVGGLSLTDEGLTLWQHHRDAALRGGASGSSIDKSHVNKAWKSPLKAAEDPNATRF